MANNVCTLYCRLSAKPWTRIKSTMDCYRNPNCTTLQIQEAAKGSYVLMAYAILARFTWDQYFLHFNSDKPRARLAIAGGRIGPTPAPAVQAERAYLRFTVKEVMSPSVKSQKFQSGLALSFMDLTFGSGTSSLEYSYH